MSMLKAKGAGAHEVSTYKRELAELAAKAGSASLPTADELCNPESTIDWAVLVRAIHTQRASVDEILRKLHFRRERAFDSRAITNIRRFLLAGYSMTCDARYLNELLWFARDRGKGLDRQVRELAVALFADNTDQSGRHVFPHASQEVLTRDIKSFCDKSNALETSPCHGLRVGLLGSPSFFVQIRKQLIELGADPRCYLVRHHSDRLPRALLRSKMLLQAYLTAKGARFPFEDLGFDPASPAIGAALRRDKIEVCYHKLGFIIKKGTIDGPRLGIINDHWGALPYVRGRSTIEWSLFHGIPMAVTTHLVDEGIDTGRLLAMFDYSRAIAGMTKVSQVRRVVKEDAVRRAILSICRLANAANPVVPNPSSVGATFYSMHADIERHLEGVILARQSGACR